MDVRTILNSVLIVLGVGFLIANARLVIEYVTFLKRRSTALLTWPSPKPPYYYFLLTLGAALAIIVVAKILVHDRLVFGETMMFVYYAYLLPLSQRIGRGFYEDGIWADGSFVPYNEVGGISWRQGEHEVTLMEEKVVPEKRVVPKERVRLEKDTATGQETVSEEVRKERVDVEREGSKRRK